MPNYARQSSLDLDEIFGHYIKNDSNAAMMRNIRTKERMGSAHHCEDKECGGGPSMRCVSALHFCWCLAPVIDKDKKSDTYDEVVICGQRFQCISPKGCAVHPYLAGYNLYVKNARNNYPNVEVEWKAIFESFKAEHDAAVANKTEQQELLKKKGEMTEPQKNRYRKLQDQAAFRKSLEKELDVDQEDTAQEVPCLPTTTPARPRRKDTKKAKRQRARRDRDDAKASEEKAEEDDVSGQTRGLEVRPA
ncbi:hypothetical protein J4E83_007577 [Alternaria metachromatica]|uniref:uncharacterized protein n=1 Tax=Alternaria metachromatica TaxID=283354 RepID=UPI0020C42B98|nr:uncharacterized protein J4E83_007577 [Alternaria metachromatica]KAI4613165.1 hypothetical protein J4E83_007577 [Alternaria metachromatica]